MHLLCLLLLCFSLPAFSAEITVSAAASLRDAFGEIATDYQKHYPDAKVKLNTAASGTLLRQLINGAPVDVLATADDATMNRAIAAQAVHADSRITFARNALVLVVPHLSATQTAAVADLRHHTVNRIAIGQPDSVPAGAYAKEALQKKGIWRDLKSKFVYTQNVRQALAYVSRGEVDAGFVYRTDALTAAGKVRIISVLATHTPVRYPAAISTNSKQITESKRFISYLQSKQAQKILQKYGFDKP